MNIQKRRQRIFAAQMIVLMATLVTGFQNCGQMSAMKVRDSASLSSTTGSGGTQPIPSLPQQPVPGPAPAPAPAPVPAPAPAPAPVPSMPPSSSGAGEPPHISRPSAYVADPVLSGRTLKVCPSGCTYSLPSQAIADTVLQDGDTVEITGGSYVDCAWVNKNNVTIRGVSVGGVRPQMHDKTCGQKGILVMNGRNSLVDNIELSGAIDNISSDHNWAGIRFDGGATGNHIVRNSFFHDNDDGFLGGAATDAVLVEGSKFEHLGRDGLAHGMYMGVGQKFILRNSVVTSNKNDGHLVKTRALANTVECNMIAGLNGQNSYAVDVPQGGDTVIRNNVIQNGPNANNHNAFVNYQEEGAVNPISNLSVHDNTLINDTPMAYFFWLPRSPNLVGWANNLLVGSGTPFDPGGSSATGVTKTTRFDAGLPPYDGTLASLPAAPFCN